MGLGSIVKKVAQVGAATTGPVGMVASGILGGALNSPGVEEPPSQSQLLSNMRGEQLGQAKRFRDNIPKIADERIGQEAAGGRRDLAANISGINKNANSRGMLYSGLREGAEADARGGYAAALAQRRAQMNEELAGQATEMENTAVQSAYQDQAAAQDALDAKFKGKQARNEARDNLIGSLSGGVGSLAGGLMGRG